MNTDKNSQAEIFSLDTLFLTIIKVKNGVAKKRLIFDQGPVGGIASKWIILFLLSLPVMLYASIFNPTMFKILGIAQAIIFFVVFLSMVMIMVFAIIFINNSKVTRKINPTWEIFFKDIDLNLALASSGTPYKEFLKYYGKAVEDGLEGDALEKKLQEDFAQMEKQNQTLMDAIRKAKTKR